MPEFLQIRTNNGDDRKKAHDVFHGLCYPNLFWKLAKEDIVRLIIKSAAETGTPFACDKS